MCWLTHGLYIWNIYFYLVSWKRPPARLSQHHRMYSLGNATPLISLFPDWVWNSLLRIFLGRSLTLSLLRSTLLPLFFDSSFFKGLFITTPLTPSQSHVPPILVSSCFTDAVVSLDLHSLGSIQIIWKSPASTAWAQIFPACSLSVSLRSDSSGFDNNISGQTDKRRQIPVTCGQWPVVGQPAHRRAHTRRNRHNITDRGKHTVSLDTGNNENTLFLRRSFTFTLVNRLN